MADRKEGFISRSGLHILRARRFLALRAPHRLTRFHVACLLQRKRAATAVHAVSPTKPTIRESVLSNFLSFSQVRRKGRLTSNSGGQLLQACSIATGPRLREA